MTLRQRVSALVDRLGLRPDGTTTDGEGEEPPEPAPWPVPQLAPGGTGVVRVTTPGAGLAPGEVRAHPNRLEGTWHRLVVDIGALVAPGVWAGAFGPGGTATGAAIERLAADAGAVELRWDVGREHLAAAGIDVGRLDALAPS